MAGRRQLSGPRPSLVATWLVAAALTVGAEGSSPSRAIPYPSASGPALPVAAVEGWSLARYGEVATAFRDGGVARVRTQLAEGSPQDRLLLGLFAHQQGATDLALELLPGGADPTGLLEDWRLFQLGDLLLAQEQLPTARQAFERLLADHPHSPLYEPAYDRHLEIAYRQGDWLAALRDIEAARQSGLDRKLTTDLAQVEWSIAGERGLDELRRTAARRLLIEDPLLASELKVVEAFRRADGELDWNEILAPRDLLRRAASLLEAGVIEGALSTLDAVHERDRGIDWTFLQAETLTADRRGEAALTVLAQRPPTPHDRLVELRRLRAAAALDAATVRSRRTNATAEQRRQSHELAWQDLWHLAAAVDPAVRREALESLYRMADIEENFDLGLDILRRLRALDATDVTGYLDLWKLGWREFDRRNATGAIGIWRELQDLYPETSRARQALYWSGVAHWELGNESRGRELLASVLSTDSFDFYARHAARRLGVAPRRALGVENVPWPDDSRLGRAALLSEIGLDAAASTELELLRAQSDSRAADGLEALISARRGSRRESIDAIWRAFPILGKPGQTAVPQAVRRLYYPAEHPDVVERWAGERGLPPYLVFGIIRQESAFDAGAVSRAGARGLMQLMPATGRELAGRLRLPFSTSRLNDPEYSVQLGTRYFAQVLEMFDGDIELALAGYNGGPYRIRRWWREAGPGAPIDRFIEGLPLTETTNYVKRILIFEDSYQLLYSGRG